MRYSHLCEKRKRGRRHIPASILIHPSCSYSASKCAFSYPLHFFEQRPFLCSDGFYSEMQLLFGNCRCHSASSSWFNGFWKVEDEDQRQVQRPWSRNQGQLLLSVKSLTGYQMTRPIKNVAHSPPIKTSQPSSDPSLSIRPASTPMRFSFFPRCKVHHHATDSPPLHCLIRVIPLMVRNRMQKARLRT